MWTQRGLMAETEGGGRRRVSEGLAGRGRRVSWLSHRDQGLDKGTGPGIVCRAMGRWIQETHKVRDAPQYMRGTGG